MRACIISIGEELLIGQTVNTNAAWMASQLNRLGIEVHEMSVIADRHDAIVLSLHESAWRADLVLITGGLGPTRDDVTKHALCDFFGSDLEMNQEVLEDIRVMFEKSGRQMNELNRAQALVPVKARALRNPYGTAPGLWFEEDEKIYVAMPGVPYEMKEMMNHHVLPALGRFRREQYIVHRSIHTQGIGESALAEKLSHWEDALPAFIQLAYLPSMGIVKMRLTAKGPDEGVLREAITKEIEKLKVLIPEYIWGYDDDSMEMLAGKLLAQHGLTLAAAESCTGGYLAHLITSVPGSSAYFKGSIVAYDNALKEKILGVPASELHEHGAVSSRVACLMAGGVQKLAATDYAVGITGIAGPDGGSAEKPVGTTWIAVAGKHECHSRMFRFADNRERNIIRATRTALKMLIDLIKKEQQE
ncbi:MAG: competence/damage-inducible protein A [Bacteroidales bacterium]|nr:competence/damage-inducible protein A [Bacteroidales bacterium]